jgi:hypothetical protein
MGEGQALQLRGAHVQVKARNQPTCITLSINVQTVTGYR